MVNYCIRNLIIIITFFLFTASSISIAHSAPIHDFNKAVAKAYKFYREAFFLLKTDNHPVASIELEKMVIQWNSIIRNFGPTPPEIFSNDQQWMDTLNSISRAISQGLDESIEGNSKKAIKTLKPIRKILSNLRERNGVYVYSDTINKANAAFKELKKFRYNPPDFSIIEEVDQLRQSLAITIYWYRQCIETAPLSISENPEFIRLMEESLYSLSRVWVAIANKKEPNLISILRGLSSSDQLLFLRFG